MCRGFWFFFLSLSLLLWCCPIALPGLCLLQSLVAIVSLVGCIGLGAVIAAFVCPCVFVFFCYSLCTFAILYTQIDHITILYVMLSFFWYHILRLCPVNIALMKAIWGLNKITMFWLCALFEFKRRRQWQQRPRQQCDCHQQQQCDMVKAGECTDWLMFRTCLCWRTTDSTQASDGYTLG